MDNPRWIERKIVAQIMQAIAATDRTTDIFYITGEGGMGKTVLLREIGTKLGSPDGVAAADDWSGILDLYHSDVNTNSGLEMLLRQSFGSGGEFRPFDDAREHYRRLVEAGFPGSDLEDERAGLAELFATCVNAVTTSHRIVIAIDTTDRIQYEMDDVQILCNIEGERSTVLPWLLYQLTKWQNCVVLLVGRKEREPYLQSALARTLRNQVSVRYREEALNGFEAEEVTRFFEGRRDLVPDLRNIEPETLQRIGEVTRDFQEPQKGSRPIRLELIVELIKRGQAYKLDRFLQEIEDLALSSDKTEVTEDDPIGLATDKFLIDALMSDEENANLKLILRYLAIAGDSHKVRSAGINRRDAAEEGAVR